MTRGVAAGRLPRVPFISKGWQMASLNITRDVDTIVTLERDRGEWTLSFRTGDATIIEDALASLCFAGFMTAEDARRLGELAAISAAA